MVKKPDKKRIDAGWALWHKKGNIGIEQAMKKSGVKQGSLDYHGFWPREKKERKSVRNKIRRLHYRKTQRGSVWWRLTRGKK